LYSLLGNKKALKYNYYVPVNELGGRIVKDE
jgi:hypothetical protein